MATYLGASEDNNAGEKCELGGARQVVEDGIYKGDEERCERLEDDEGVDIDAVEEVGVGEDDERKKTSVAEKKRLAVSTVKGSWWRNPNLSRR
ncbi:uncharacterized protein DS421_6g196980 [Arachis hypogaea]|nr:uncharacterized protein DS421_6g196980 [Arachis hypogaea]